MQLYAFPSGHCSMKGYHHSFYLQYIMQWTIPSSRFSFIVAKRSFALFCDEVPRKWSSVVMLLILLIFSVMLLLQLLLHLKTFKSGPMLCLFTPIGLQPFVTIVERCSGGWCARDSNVKVSCTEMQFFSLKKRLLHSTSVCCV